MGVKNNGMCLHCRSRSHESKNCGEKVKCPKCEIGWRQCFMVEKDSSLYKGCLFYTCTRQILHKCSYWELIGPPEKGEPDYEEGEGPDYEGGEDHVYEEGESSNVAGELVEDFNKQNQMDKISALMEKCADISEKKNVGVSLRLYEFTFQKKTELP